MSLENQLLININFREMRDSLFQGEIYKLDFLYRMPHLISIKWQRKVWSRAILKRQGISFESSFVCVFTQANKGQTDQPVETVSGGYRTKCRRYCWSNVNRPQWRYRYRFLARLARERACGFEPQVSMHASCKFDIYIFDIEASW